jgi:hypothetical protein
MSLTVNFKGSELVNRTVIKNQRNRKERKKKNRNEGRKGDVKNKERNPSEIEERRGKVNELINNLKKSREIRRYA